jgi:hypothetical protein
MPELAPWLRHLRLLQEGNCINGVDGTLALPRASTGPCTPIAIDFLEQFPARPVFPHTARRIHWEMRHG